VEASALVDALAVELQARVLTGAIPSGARLRQEAIAEEFGVSRTPVREALRKLQAMGVVVLEPHRGAIVRGPTSHEVREAYDVRAELEGYAAELASVRIQDSQLRALRDAVALFRRSCESLVARRDRDSGWSAADIRTWTRANDEFHQQVQQAAGNERLRATIADLHLSFPRDLTAIVLKESSRLLEQNVDQHAAVLEAIERRDAPAARRLMVEHVHTAGALVTLRFEQRERAVR